MSDDLIIYEAGVRIGNNYSKFTESPDKQKTIDYIEILKVTKPENSEIILLEKTYRVISTIPHIVNCSVKKRGGWSTKVSHTDTVILEKLRNSFKEGE